MWMIRHVHPPRCNHPHCDARGVSAADSTVKVRWAVSSERSTRGVRRRCDRCRDGGGVLSTPCPGERRAPSLELRNCSASRPTAMSSLLLARPVLVSAHTASPACRPARSVGRCAARRASHGGAALRLRPRRVRLLLPGGREHTQCASNAMSWCTDSPRAPTCG